MPRITIRTSCLLPVLAAMALSTGCRKEYARDRLGTDSGPAGEVRGMIDALREAGKDRLDEMMQRQAADGLTANQHAALTAALGGLIAADSVELQQIDRFGDGVYRVSLLLSSEDNTTTVYLLLVMKHDQLLWAGPS